MKIVFAGDEQEREGKKYISAELFVEEGEDTTVQGRLECSLGVWAHLKKAFENVEGIKCTMWETGRGHIKLPGDA